MMNVLHVLLLYFNYRAHIHDERRYFYVTLANAINSYLKEGHL